MSRRICFIITSFIHYSRSIFILEALQNRPDVELHVILGGAALLPKYISKLADIKHDLLERGIANIHEMYFNLEGTLGITKAKTAGLGIIEFASLFEAIKPDIVVVRADRFEVLSAAVAAAYMNIPIAHIEGGDVSGTVDESVRHAITKLAHIHFVTNKPAQARVFKMGEQNQYVFNFGSPDIEVVQRLLNEPVDLSVLANSGSGAALDLTKPYVMVIYHPVTSELEHLAEYTRAILAAVHELGIPAIWFWPNFDAGAEEISRELRVFNDTARGHQFRFMRYLPPKHFLYLLKNTQCLIGNSSAGIKECSYLGIPVVNIGLRQKNRLRAGNVLDVPDHVLEEILRAIRQQLAVGRFPSATVYKANNTSQEIANVLATVTPYVQKTFFDHSVVSQL